MGCVSRPSSFVYEFMLVGRVPLPFSLSIIARVPDVSESCVEIKLSSKLSAVLSGLGRSRTWVSGATLSEARANLSSWLNWRKSRCGESTGALSSVRYEGISAVARVPWTGDALRGRRWSAADVLTLLVGRLKKRRFVDDGVELERAQSTLRIRDGMPGQSDKKEYISESRVGGTKGRSSRQATGAAGVNGGDDARRCTQDRHIRSELTKEKRQDGVARGSASRTRARMLLIRQLRRGNSMRMSVRMMMLAAREGRGENRW